MLSAEDNDRLTRVGPGTPMGALLRRYWTPALLAAELPEPGCAPVRVRLFGEDLVATRDRAGRAGLDRYPVHESGGIVWTYLGPADKQPPFRDFGTESLPPEKVAATKLHTTCNWVQAMEGNLDTSHISWLHQWDGVEDIPDDGSDKPGYPSNAMSWKFWRHDRAPRLEIEDTWYGFKYAGIRTTPNANTHVRVTAFCYPFFTVVAALPFSTRHGVFVPIDDENTARFTFVTRAVENPRGIGGPGLFALTPFTHARTQAGTGVIPRRYTAENDFGIDRAAQRGVSYSGVAEFMSQDFMVTETMGPICDRTQEHLGTSDKAIIRMRRLLLAAAKRVAEGGDAPAIEAGLDYRGIRSAEKILEPGEDWRVLGTDDDPLVRETDRRPPG